MISAKDRSTLREVAKRVTELAASERNRQLYRDWKAYGAGRPTRPLIRIELNTFEEELLPGLMRCEGEEARRIERELLRPVVNFTLFEDDTLVPDYYGVTEQFHFVPFGLEVRVEQTGGVGHHFIPYLTELESDDHLLGPSVFGVDEEKAQKQLEQAQELFGDVLPVKRISNAAYCTPMQDIIHIMNMDDLYIAMIDEEERFCAMLERLCDDYIALFRLLESRGVLTGGAEMQHLCQGSYCFTNELEDGTPAARLKDMWLFMDAQETAGISPAMYRDLVFPYYKKIMDLFGLLSYGCCEATHPVWEDCLSRIGHLRKASISPWCDEALMGERLRGTGITYLRKPPATLLGMNTPTLEEDAVLSCFRKTAEAAKGCKLEIAQRDVYTVGGSAEKVRRYVQLARQGLEG